VTRRKQRQISRTALLYLHSRGLFDVPVRFDVIGVIVTETDPKISHVINAFEVQ
jgi:Holliday junction resolvase-like predicted endonuclease